MLISPEILNSIGLEACIKKSYLYWADILENNIDFNLKNSLIHTRLHSIRVLIYSLLIAQKLNLTNQEIKSLCITSIFHDTKRQDDWLDVGHGLRAAKYYKDYSMIHNWDFDKIAFLIMAYHDRDDNLFNEYFNSTCSNSKDLLLYQIFKDADALDRFRLGENNLEPNMLRIDYSKTLIPFAKWLVKNTTKFNLV